MASREENNFETVLEYKIYKCSSYSTAFPPDNIIVDKPYDQSSRWSTDNDNYPQYIILKLKQPSIVKTITFGKFDKAHVCNVKKFKVHGGLELGNMMELVESGLRNDTIPETFELKNTIGDEERFFPSRYIKILLLQSWGPNMNSSVWYIKLTGSNNLNLVKNSVEWFHQFRQKEVIRLCMKHFRKYQCPEIVETLEKVTGVRLEDQYLSALYNLLVVEGKHLEAENFMLEAVQLGYLDEYINAQLYQVMWTKLVTSDPKPGKRGGHQMVLDSDAELLYLFGGWNGNQDLSDLWTYNINDCTWTLICDDTSAVGGPNARSCHKMCLDPHKRQLFTLGRYLDTQFRIPENLKSDFYVYDIDSNKWTLISEDTAAVGGPDLIFDHQMLMDISERTIYVFGGRILVSNSNQEENGSNDSQYSGLYSYYVPTGTWKKLASDASQPIIQNVPSIRSRVGHSMLFHPDSRKLYIFAGQRGKEYLNDFFTYEVDTNKIEQISLSELGNKDSNHCPAAGFTQRATLDPELGEIYVLSGLSKDKEKRDDNAQNSFWVYSIKTNKWSCIYRNENVGETYWNKMQDVEPCPRFAHQLVYDHIKKLHYLFGGNPGRSGFPKLRLDDFWKLQLCKPSQTQVLNKCKLIIRKQKFEELAMTSSFEAMEYLQTKVSEIINHKDEEQSKEFHLLASIIFHEQIPHKDRTFYEDDDLTDFLGVKSSRSLEQNLYARRTKLFDKLSEFFPKSCTYPRANLLDLLPL